MTIYISDIIKKYLLWIVGLIILLLISWHFRDNNLFRHQIKEDKKVIDSQVKTIKDSEARADLNKKEALNWQSQALANEEEARIFKDKATVSDQKAKDLEAKIQTMPAPEIVIRTIQILEVAKNDVILQSQGIVFTLVASKKNLVILEGFSLAKEKATNLEFAIKETEHEVSNLKNSILSLNSVLDEKNFQLKGKDNIIQNWEQMFKLSQKERRKNWWKGFETGSVLTGVGIILIKVFLLK